MLTSDKLNKSAPQTQLDWTGAPMREGQPYGGKPEHCAPETPPEDKDAKKGVQRRSNAPLKRQFSAQGLANLRASMKRCREALEQKRARAKANA